MDLVEGWLGKWHNPLHDALGLFERPRPKLEVVSPTPIDSTGDVAIVGDDGDGLRMPMQRNSWIVGTYSEKRHIILHSPCCCRHNI